VKELGLADAVGVSNFNEARVRKAAKVLEARGTCLSSNQVQYSLLYRKPETNGVMEACRRVGRGRRAEGRTLRALVGPSVIS
jgi:aryl-alcohol dehydrogenase-like predicted oxidoreductase